MLLHLASHQDRLRLFSDLHNLFFLLHIQLARKHLVFFSIFKRITQISIVSRSSMKRHPCLFFGFMLKHFQRVSRVQFIIDLIRLPQQYANRLLLYVYSSFSRDHLRNLSRPFDAHSDLLKSCGVRFVLKLFSRVQFRQICLRDIYLCHLLVFVRVKEILRRISLSRRWLRNNSLIKVCLDFSIFTALSTFNNSSDADRYPSWRNSFLGLRSNVYFVNSYYLSAFWMPFTCSMKRFLEFRSGIRLLTFARFRRGLRLVINRPSKCRICEDLERQA